MQARWSCLCHLSILPIFPLNDTFSLEHSLKEKVGSTEAEVLLGTESEIHALPLPRYSMLTRSGFFFVTIGKQTWIYASFYASLICRIGISPPT